MATSTHREYLSREAKKWMRFVEPSMKRTAVGWPHDPEHCVAPCAWRKLPALAP
jgi:hypothetical protein